MHPLFAPQSRYTRVRGLTAQQLKDISPPGTFSFYFDHPTFSSFTWPDKKKDETTRICTCLVNRSSNSVDTVARNDNEIEIPHRRGDVFTTIFRHPCGVGGENKLCEISSATRDTRRSFDDNAIVRSVHSTLVPDRFTSPFQSCLKVLERSGLTPLQVSKLVHRGTTAPWPPIRIHFFDPVLRTWLSVGSDRDSSAFNTRNVVSRLITRRGIAFCELHLCMYVHERVMGSDWFKSGEKLPIIFSICMSVRNFISFFGRRNIVSLDKSGHDIFQAQGHAKFKRLKLSHIGF